MIGEMLRYFPYPDFMRDAWISLFVAAVSLAMWLFYCVQVFTIIRTRKTRQAPANWLSALLLRA